MNGTSACSEPGSNPKSLPPSRKDDCFLEKRPGALFSLGPLFLSVFFFVVYLHTTCPTVYLGDSGELIAAAYSLGIPHNSGYPLYAMLGKGFALIPLGNVGFRLNLMSVFFGAAAIGLIGRLLVRLTGSPAVATAATAILAVSPLFWSQTASAEVYPLHTFFVALLLTLLEWWDRDRTFFRLPVFSLLTGLSFGNHLQTVMMAPAVFYFILSGEKNALLNLKRLSWSACLFLIPLMAYAYLPVRTMAGVAVHWGDPDTWDRFLAHVSASSHRTGYVFGLTLQEYSSRFREALELLWDQFGVLVLVGLWGLVAFRQRRWVLLSGLIFLFDLGYTVALNTVSLHVTSFMLPGCMVWVLLIGSGMHDLLRRSTQSSRIGSPLKRIMVGVCGLVPALLFVSRIGLCDQSRNFTAYEYGLNILRTCGNGAVLFLEGDNHFFPVVYGRVVERMRMDIRMYDRHNILFKMPYLGDGPQTFHGNWEGLRTLLEEWIIRHASGKGVYYAVFDPTGVRLPDDHVIVSDGILYRALPRVGVPREGNPWPYYALESLFEPLSRDYLNRQMASQFYFHFGRRLIRSGKEDRGMTFLEKASRIGYNDTGIHSLIAGFFIEQGLLERSREELEKATIYNDRPSVVHNLWGCYFFAQGDYGRAASAFRKAVAAAPGNAFYHKNLGQALERIGKHREAIAAFRKALSLREDLTGLRRYLEGVSRREGVRK